MNKALRLLVLVLAVAMLLPAVVACDGGKTDDPSATTTGNVVNTEDPYETQLPTIDWDEDTFFVLGRDGGTYTQFNNFEISRETMDGDVVGDAVWTRNEALRKKYNFLVDHELVTNPASDALTLYDAQDDVYDLVIYKSNQVFTHASSGYLLDLNTVMYINFDHPTWNADINSELTVGGKLYASTSQFLLQDKARTYTLFYNRELARDYDMGYLEDHVDANTWTLEKFEEVSRKLTFDIDGGGAGDQADSFGVAAESYGSFVALVYGAGFRFGANDGETISLRGSDSSTLNAMNNVITAVGKVWFDKTVLCEPQMFEVYDPESPTDIFCDERSLFFSSFPSAFDTGLNKKCTFEFGVVPFPKIDANQERYYNYMNISNDSIFAIPYTVADPAQVGFYLQAISEEACKTSYTAYIESKCKVQDSYDELTAKMLDMSFKCVTYDVVCMLNPGSIYSIIVSDIPFFNTNVFVRLYQNKGTAPADKLDELIAKFEANG